jgi:Domain of Unknown Function (DUF928)
MELKTMAWKKSLLSLTVLSLGMSLELATIAIGSAQAGVSHSISERTWQLSQFNPPDRGAPNTGVAGATRGGLLCNEITPLSPKDVSRDYGSETPPYFGLTVTEKPTLLFDVAGTPQYSGVPVYFEILELNKQGAGSEVVYSTSFNLPTTPGVIGVPTNVVLEEGKSYLWYMEMTCNPSTSNAETAGIYGSMDRVTATEDLTRQLNMAKTPEDRSRVYGEAGIWFNALDTLAQARMIEDTPDLDASWKALLQAIDLPEENKERIVNSPLVNCCSVESASDGSGVSTSN